MFCPNCGTDNPTGAFCKECGTPLNQPAEANAQETPAVNPVQIPIPVPQPVQIPVPQPVVPNFTQPYPPAPAPAPALGRKEFKNQVASKRYKANSLVCLILAAVLTLAMIGSYIISINTSLDKIPLISLVLSVADEGKADDEFEDIMAELSYEIARGRAKLESARYDCTDEEYNLLCEFWDVAEKCAKNFSISNIKKFTDKAEELSKSYTLREYADLSSSSVSDDIDDINTVIDIASGIILGFMIFALCFTAPGAFCKIKGLVIAGMILTLIYSLIFCPVWVTILLIALHIVMIVFISIVKNEYKEYTRNPQAYIQKNV